MPGIDLHTHEHIGHLRYICRQARSNLGPRTARHLDSLLYVRDNREQERETVRHRQAHARFFLFLHACTHVRIVLCSPRQSPDGPSTYEVLWRHCSYCWSDWY